MKLLSIVFDAAVEGFVQKALRENGITCYLKVPKLLGRMGNCEPLLDTHVWPGYALWYLVPLDEDQLEKCKPRLRELAQEYSSAGFRAFLLPTEEVL